MLVAVVVAVGLAGVVIPLVPSSSLILLAILVWSVRTGGAAAWGVFTVAAALLVGGAVVKYVVPGRRLRGVGIPTSTLLAGGLLGVVGFFVVPVVGLVIGFLVGVYLAEWRRLQTRADAWPATVHAVQAVGLGILIEFVFAMLAAAAWATGVVIT